MLYSYMRVPGGRMRQEWAIGAGDGLLALPLEAEGSPWFDIVVEEDREILAARRVRLQSGQYSEDEVRLRTGAGVLRRVRLLGYPQLRSGTLRRVIGAAIDVTDAVPGDQAGDRDPLTGLANYLAFQDALQAAIDASDGEHGVAVLFVNLNAYNEIALNFGVPAADIAAVEAARRLLRIEPRAARLARIHTDEFVCFMPGLAVADIPLLARGFQAALEAPLDVEGIEVSVEPVIGAAWHPDHGDLPRHLVRRAAIAAAIALAQGEVWHLFEGKHDSVGRNLSLMQDLRAALRRQGELSLVYQPQVDLGSGRITGVEALLRWAHPRLGMVPPSQFLPQAEATRLIGELFHWTLSASLAQLAEWHRRLPSLQLALNISGRNLADPQLAEDVLGALRRTGLPASALKLEVTETALLEYETGVAQLRDLMAAGVGVALDDFGTGYSSLSHLQRLPLTEIKIDRSFAVDVDSNAANRRLVALIVNVAEVFGLDTVAEGVESAEAAAVLTGLGCRAAQGYHFHRPAPAANLSFDGLV